MTDKITESVARAICIEALAEYSDNPKAYDALATAAIAAYREAVAGEAVGWTPPQDCDGKEQLAFEAWASSNHYDMQEHPLHYVFMDKRTHAARYGWKAALRYVRDIFSAPPAPQPRVKPLVWEDPNSRNNYCWAAESPFGDYSVINEDGWFVGLDRGSEPFELDLDRITGTKYQAQQAAQADYEKRILSALESAPAPIPTGYTELLEAAHEVISCGSDTYKKRNGHIASFEDGSGEKCWIVPFDAFEGLRSAMLTAAPTPEAGE